MIAINKALVNFPLLTPSYQVTTCLSKPRTLKFNTFFSGYYMFIEASYPQVYGDRAVLRGPWMKSDW